MRRNLLAIAKFLVRTPKVITRRKPTLNSLQSDIVKKPFV